MRKGGKFVLFFLLFFPAGFTLNGQSNSDISLMRTSAVIETAGSYFNTSRNNKNEYELLFSGFFLFYKSFLSSQDIPGACSFTPSCSEYGLYSIKKFGILFGVINSFDRLSRCNGMTSGQYSVDKHTGKYLDYP